MAKANSYKCKNASEKTWSGDIVHGCIGAKWVGHIHRQRFSYVTPLIVWSTKGRETSQCISYLLVPRIPVASVFYTLQMTRLWVWFYMPYSMRQLPTTWWQLPSACIVNNQRSSKARNHPAGLQHCRPALRPEITTPGSASSWGQQLTASTLLHQMSFIAVSTIITYSANHSHYYNACPRVDLCRYFSTRTLLLQYNNWQLPTVI